MSTKIICDIVNCGNPIDPSEDPIELTIKRGKGKTEANEVYYTTDASVDICHACFEGQVVLSELRRIRKSRKRRGKKREAANVTV